MERVHEDATRGRDAAITRCNEEAEGCGPAEKIAEEQKLSPENEERLRRDATAKLAEEHERRVHAESETRAVQAVLDVEAEGRKAQEARVASLEEEMGRLSLVQAGVEKELDDVVSVKLEVDFPSGPMKKHVRHLRVYGDVKDMQQAADTMHMCNVIWSGRFQRGRAIIHIVLLLPCCCRRCSCRRLACCHFFLRSQAGGLLTAGKLMRSVHFGFFKL